MSGMPERALVAISEDRNLYTVLSKEPNWHDGRCRFMIFRWSTYAGDYCATGAVSDTGQDAHEVLASWMEEQPS